MLAQLGFFCASLEGNVQLLREMGHSEEVTDVYDKIQRSHVLECCQGGKGDLYVLLWSKLLFVCKAGSHA